MAKFYPLLTVLVVVIMGALGLYFFLNDSSQNKAASNLGQTPTPTPTNVIINNPTQEGATNGANMDNFKTTTSGLKIQDEIIGTGQEVKSGNTVTVHYLGTLENGTKFDSSYDRNQPFTTQIGVGQVITGWDEGIVGMKVGGKRKLIIPPNLGYGEQGAGGAIPPNSILVFEVELLSVK